MSRKFYWIIPTILLLLLLILFPTLASNPIGKPFLIKAMEVRLGGQVSIERVELSWFGPQVLEKISFSNPDVTGEVEKIQSRVPLWALSGSHSFRLENGTFSFSSYGGGQMTQVNATIEGSDIDATGTTPQGGHLSLKGKMYEQDDFDLVADLENMPTGALDQLLKAKGLLYQLLGATFNLTGNMVYNRGDGTLTLHLTSSQAQASLNGVLIGNALTLKEPFSATFPITKELGDSLASHVNPAFLTGLEGRTPVTLEISPKNFICPVSPFKLKDIRVGSGRLDLGQLRADPGGSLQALLILLKSSRGGKSMNIWFTPMAFQIEHGLVQMGRMDMLLADSIHLCSWGNIDLGRNLLDMFLGLPSDTLASAFGLQNLPRNYVLKIPVRGSIENPDIDTSGASSKIAAMVATQQIPKVVGGSKGKLFGGILNVVMQPKEDDDVPPPNRPFPWER